MTKHLKTAALFAVLAVLGCGSERTGLNVRIDPPAGSKAGLSFNKIYVLASSDARNVGDTVPVSEATAQPYRVIVWAPDDEPTKVTLTVELQKDATTYVQRIQEAQFAPGELKEVVVSWE